MNSTAARKLRQLPQSYQVMGVDPHKKKHAAAVISHGAVSAWSGQIAWCQL